MPDRYYSQTLKDPELSFSEVLEALQNPKYRAYRQGWNAKKLGVECYIYQEPAKTIPADVVREPQKSWLNGKPMKICAHLVAYFNGEFFEWSPSNLDLMAQDWVIIVP